MTASMTDAIKDAFGAEYEGGQSRDVLYVAGGYTIDYAHHPTVIYNYKVWIQL